MPNATTQLYVNLPVSSIDATTRFFKGLGFEFNPMFSNHEAVCMTLSEMASVMFLQNKRFSDFTPKAIADATKTSEVLLCISSDSRDAVDQFMQQALSLGATEVRDPQDYGFMYGRSFNDLDGHIWEVMWMDVAQFPGCDAVEETAK